MENKDNMDQQRQGKLLTMQLLLEIEELKFFVIDDIPASDGKDLSNTFSPLYMQCIELFKGAEKFMSENLKTMVFNIINDSHKVFLEYQDTLQKENKKFWDKMETEYIQKFTNMYNDINDEFKIS